MIEPELIQLRDAGAQITEANSNVWRELVIANGFDGVMEVVVRLRRELGKGRHIGAAAVTEDLGYEIVGLQALMASRPSTPADEAPKASEHDVVEVIGEPVTVVATFSPPAQAIETPRARKPRAPKPALTTPAPAIVILATDLDGELLPLLELLLQAYADRHEIEFMPQARARLQRTLKAMFA